MLVSLVTALALAGSMPRAARADLGTDRWTISLKGGAFFPVHGAMKDQTRAEWWYAGIDLDPGLLYKPAGGVVHFGADVNLRDVNGRGVFSIPVLAKIIWPITSPADPVYFYGGLGPGAYFINSRYSGAVTKPGVQFVAGINLGERVYIETAYDWVSAFYDDTGTALRADGLKVALGIRF
jgi:hypothetical protein